MTYFKYLAKSSPETVVTGTLEAPSTAIAVDRLAQQGLMPLSVTTQEQSEGLLEQLFRSGSRKVKTAALADFTRQLANLFGAGITLTEALSLLSKQTASRRLQTAALQVCEAIQSGSTLAQGLEAAGGVFPKMYVSMVAAGEEAGYLEDVLLRLADSLETERELRSKVSSAMVYPVFLASVGLGTVVILMTQVIPRFKSIFESVSSQLPLPTRILINLSSILTHWWPVAVGVSLVLFVAVRQWLRTESGRLAFDRFRLRLPAFGKLILHIELARLTRTLGLMLANGVIMLKALAVTADTLGNRFIAAQVRTAARQVAEGCPLWESLAKGGLVSATVLGMVRVGEATGSLDKMLLRIASQYEQDTARSVKVLVNLLEPVMIVVLGGTVGFIVVAMLLPIFSITTAIR